jgi:hypothetical protein
VRVLRNANIEVQFFPPDLMEEIEELNRNFTRQFHEANRVAETRAPAVRPISPDEQKITDILKFKGKPITVFNKQKYGHGYLEGTFDAVVVDCDSLGIILSTSGSNTPLSFSRNQIEVSRDIEKKTLKFDSVSLSPASYHQALGVGCHTNQRRLLPKRHPQAHALCRIHDGLDGKLGLTSWTSRSRRRIVVGHTATDTRNVYVERPASRKPLNRWDCSIGPVATVPMKSECVAALLDHRTISGDDGGQPNAW